MKKRKNQPKNKGANRLLYIVLFVIFGLLLLFVPGQNHYLKLQTGDQSNKKTISLPAPAPYPINVSGILPDRITAEGVMVLDFDSNVTLFAHNEHKKMAPASTTKLMTALVALEQYDLDEVLTVQTVLDEGRVMGLQSGEKITVENLLYGTLIHSGNDAAYTLSDNYPGGVDAFVVQMNRKAQELVLSETNFTNPIGFDDPEHYTTPFDLLRLAKAVIAHKELAKMVAIPSITVSNVNYTIFHKLQNVNELVGKIPGVSGLKTGFTEHAGESVVSSVERDGHKVLLVTLKSEDRFRETEELINWVFTNFRWEQMEPEF